MIKINYLDERELLINREIKTMSPRAMSLKCYPILSSKRNDTLTTIF